MRLFIYLLLILFLPVQANENIPKYKTEQLSAADAGNTAGYAIKNATIQSASINSQIIASGFVASHGSLRVNNGTLVDQHGSPIQLRGMSSHGLQWYANYMNLDALRAFRDDWNINVIRAALYTWEEGYIANPGLEKEVFNIIEMAVALDIYVIVDWHILIDHDPNIHIKQSKTFFEKVSKRYSDIPNIIYEIANEPSNGGVWGDKTFNGYPVNWKEHIKPYAEEVIPIIRKADADAAIIVGTGTWSQDVDSAARDPLAFDNVLYALHFYACDHGQNLRDKATKALATGVAIFSTEWGTTAANGDGRVCTNEADAWLNFFDKNNISWVNWNISDKSESSATFIKGTPSIPPDDGKWSEARLTTSGKYVRERLRRY